MQKEYFLTHLWDQHDTLISKHDTALKNIDHILAHEAKLSQFQRTAIKQTGLLKPKLKIKKKSSQRDFYVPSTWKLQSTLLNVRSKEK